MIESLHVILRSVAGAPECSVRKVLPWERIGLSTGVQRQENASLGKNYLVIKNLVWLVAEWQRIVSELSGKNELQLSSRVLS